MEKLKISDKCAAFVTDGNLAISWGTYWTEERQATKSVSYFRVTWKAVLDAARRAHPSSCPRDYLESCFWVFAWAVLFNEDITKDQSTRERFIKEHLAKSHKEIVGAKPRATLNPLRNHSNITKRFSPVLNERWMKVRDQGTECILNVLDSAPEDADGEYHLLHFHCFALQGFVDVLEVLENHWEGEINWESWTSPASST